MSQVSPTPIVDVVILAAGRGTRMVSDIPKCLHAIGGRPLLAHVLAAAQSIAGARVHGVHGYGGDALQAAFADTAIEWVAQSEQLGTGHAVAQAMPGIADDSIVLVVYGDVPLIRADTLRALIAVASKDESTLALLTAVLADGANYGRIVRDAAGKVERIVERKDASAEEIAIPEINTGILAAPAAPLRRWLAALSNDNAQGEYYLTDIIAMAVSEGMQVQTQNPASISEIEGINSKVELARMERSYQMQQAEALMDAGLTLRDPARLDVRGSVEHGRDVVIDVNVILEGDVSLADGVHIGPNTYIKNSVIGESTEILANCVIEDSTIGKRCRIGPFARLRPGASFADNIHIGNFVEIKNSNIADGSKVNHLSYIGDTDMGAGVNIGAGTITANYDGVNKHRTTIADAASTGSNSVLVAPVTVGKGATLGAGTVLRKDAPAGELSLPNAKTRTISGWKRPKKKED